MSQHRCTRLTRRTLLRSGAALGTMGVLAGCIDPTRAPGIGDEVTTPSPGAPTRGGLLRYGLSTDPANLEPHVNNGTAAQVVKEMIYNSLLKYDERGRIVGDLADEFGYLDQLTYQVKIRRGVTFHDGSPLTVEDVVFTFQRILDEKTAAADAARYADVAEIRTDGKDTVVFRLRRPNVVLPHALASSHSVILSKRWIESGVDPKIKSMGTGPFRLLDRVPGVSTTLKRFDDYFESGLPHLNGIQFLPMEDDYARVTALRSAVVDFIDYVPTTHIDTLRATRGVKLASDKTFGFWYVGFVLDRKPLRDPRVRQAIAYGIDRDAVLRTAYLGHGEPMTGGVIPPGMLGHDPALTERYTYDPDRSRHLLRKAGVGSLDVEILDTSSYSVVDRPAQAMLPSLRKAGTRAQLIRREWLSYLNTVAAKTYPLYVYGNKLEFSDPDALTNLLQSDSSYAGYSKFTDDRVDSLLAQGRKETDEGKRADIYHAVEERVLDLLPWTYAVRRLQAEAMRSEVRGYVHPAKGSAWTQRALRGAWLARRE